MDKVKSTWSNISKASSPSIEVKLPPSTPLDLKPLCDVLEEGFKRHLMAFSNELTDGLELLDKAVLEHASQVDSACAGIIENQKDLIEVLTALNSRVSALGLSMELCAKNIDSVEDNLPVIANAIKNIKLDANIPITNLSVGLPKYVVYYTLLAPVLYALWSILILKFFH